MTAGRRIEPGVVAEVKRRTSLAELVAESGLAERWRPGGRGEWKGCCPFHSERSPSFYVVSRDGGEFFYCFGCGASGDAVKWVRLTTTAKDFAEAIEYLMARCGMSGAGPALAARPPTRRPADDLREAREAQRRAAARAIWAGREPALEHTAVARYLRRTRRLRVPIPPTICAHPALPHPHLPPRDGGPLIGFPAMLAPVTDLGRRVVGVHCTYLEPDGSGKMTAPAGWPPPWMDPAEKWRPKIMRGLCWQGAIRLTPAEGVMIIAEGIETALSVLQALWEEEAGGPQLDGEAVGVWAAGSLGNMGAILLPPGVREVILAADSDGKMPDADSPARGDPETVLEAAAARHREAGRAVRIARPPQGQDFNDMLPPGAGAAGDPDDGTLGEAAA